MGQIFPEPAVHRYREVVQRPATVTEIGKAERAFETFQSAWPRMSFERFNASCWTWAGNRASELEDKDYGLRRQWALTLRDALKQPFPTLLIDGYIVHMLKEE